MHELRTAIAAGEAPSNSPVARKETCRRRAADGSLIAVQIPREERRQTNQRREDRLRGVVERATIIFRRKKSLVKVVNISTSGIMVETGIVPRIGETIAVEFDGFDRLEGTVCWVKQGRIGIDLGEGSIAIG